MQATTPGANRTGTAHSPKNVQDMLEAVEALSPGVPIDTGSMDDGHGRRLVGTYSCSADMQHFTQSPGPTFDISQAGPGVAVLLHSQRVDLRDVVSRAVATIACRQEAQRRHLECLVPERAAWTSGDPERLEQVFVHLLSNAAKFTEPGGRITAAIEAQPQELVVGIRDNGIGIAPHVMPRVFQAFVRADESGASRGTGRGLGLSIARSLVELHGGSISAASPGPGLGSVFTVRLRRIE